MQKAITYGLTHVAVVVADLDRTRKFYQGVFDMEVMYDQEDLLQLTTPGCHDILVFEKGKVPPQPNAGGIAHVGFRLREPGAIHAMREKIIAAGGRIREEGEFVPGSPYIFFYDPDGYELEVWYEVGLGLGLRP